MIYIKSLPIIVLALFTMAAAAYAQSSGEPRWILNPGQSYDENQYLMAVGSGEEIQKARDQAMSNLSQIFQANVQAEEQLIEDFSQTFSNSGEYSSSGSTQLLNNIKIGTQQSLMNTRVLDSYKENDNMYYVLVGMERQPTGLIYSQEISNNEMAINRLEERANSAPGVLQQLAVLRSAILLSQINENLLRQLSIIRGTGTGAANAGQITRLQNAFDEAKSRSIVRIQAGNIPNDLLNAVSAAFQEAGFVVSNSSTPLIAVEVNYEVTTEDLGRDDAEFVRFILTIQLTDLERNQQYRAFIAEEREGGISMSRARSRALYTARSMIGRDFSRFLRQELLSLDI